VSLHTCTYREAAGLVACPTRRERGASNKFDLRGPWPFPSIPPLNPLISSVSARYPSHPSVLPSIPSSSSSSSSLLWFASPDTQAIESLRVHLVKSTRVSARTGNGLAGALVITSSVTNDAVAVPLLCSSVETAEQYPPMCGLPRACLFVPPALGKRRTNRSEIGQGACPGDFGHELLGPGLLEMV
jgi:hypothetical protein